jgi:hypothetical protein
LKSLLVIPYYLELQRRMLDTFRYVSCHERNFGTYSIVLESLLIDTCSFFDSLCQTFIRKESTAGRGFNEEPRVGQFREKVDSEKDFNFGDYRKLLEGDFVLSAKRVSLNLYEDAFLDPMHSLPDSNSGYLIAPFLEWASITEDSSPWWTAFTHLKHDRIINSREATLKNALYSLASAFIMLTLTSETDFKTGAVPLEVYNLFFPKYWTFKGRVSVMNFTWS